MFKKLIPASVVLAAFVAACAGTGSTPAPTAAPVATPAPATVAAASPTAPPTLNFTVSLAPAGFFVGPNGHTLYTFDKDTLGVSNCQASQCVTNWPALTLEGGVQLAIGAGLTESDFATITRDDGTDQVTFKDIPLYYFAGDAAVGDKNGDGVGGIWHLATKTSTLPTPSAEPSSTASPAASAAASPAGSLAAGSCYDAHYQVIPCPSASAAAGSPAATTVTVASAGYLVGPTGMTLYVFDNDKTANTTTCTGDCATNWPALTIDTGATVTIGAGLDQEDFATFTRSDDSTTQVSYYGKPLYMFAGDAAAGDTNGDGVAGIWHLAMPQ